MKTSTAKWTNQLHATEHNTPKGGHPYRCEVRDLPNGELIAVVFASDRGKAEANARAISEVPAMIETLKDLLNHEAPVGIGLDSRWGKALAIIERIITIN